MKRYLFGAGAVTLALLLVATFNVVVAREEGTGGERIGKGGQEQTAIDVQEGIGESGFAPAYTYDASLSIPGAALKPRESSVEWASTGGPCLHASNGDTTIWWNAPVYLPEGATVKTLRMFTHDTNSSNDSHAYFSIYSVTGTLIHEYGVWSEGTSGMNSWDTDEFTATVDNDNYYYIVHWQPNEVGNDMRLCGFRILYQTLPGAIYLPVIKKP